MNYNNEKYALLEFGLVEQLYYDLDGEIVRDGGNSKVFNKGEDGNWYLFHHEFISNIWSEVKSKIIKFGNSKEELLKVYKESQNEQWKLDGNCELCRRKNYCKTQCSMSKKNVDRTIHNAVMNTFFKGIPQDILDSMKKYR